MRNAFSAFSPRLATALPAAFSKASVAAFCAAIAFTTLAGCETHFTNAGPDGWTGADGVNADGASSDGLNGAAEKLFIGDGVGAKCKTDDTCRGGLACTGGVCMPAGKKLANDACILSADCEKQLQCGFFGFCVPNGGKGVTEVCTSVSDCTKGLYCDLLGVSGFCTAPAKTAKDLYGACKGSGDCLPGLHCGDAKTCLPGSVTLNPDLFPGSTCPVRQEEQLPFQARNRIPRGDESVHGFYSTPFPSNLRLTKAGKVDLSAHPRPGTGLIGLDLVGNVINSIGAEMTGFSVAPGVYFRWTRPLDPKTFYQSGPTQNIHFVELTPGLPPAAYQVDYTTNFQPARNKYICGNWLTVHPTWKRPLKSKTTYAVYVTDTVRAVLPEGAEPKDALPVQGDDLPLLLATKAPKAAADKAAWDHYAPLRAFIAANKVPAAKIVAATLFTTQDPTRLMRQFGEIANKSVAPAIIGAVHRCGVSKGASPCATPGFAATPEGKAGKTDPRDCPANAAAAAWNEYHFLLKVPVYQAGTRPYLTGGGSLKLVGDKPQIVGYEDVCTALTLPKTKMPAAGWPTLIYAHGTGGSHRSGVGQMAKQVTALKDGSISTNMAMLGIDQPMHGSRRGLPLDPGPLFYNFANPPAAKGNFYQGAADNHTLIRFLRSFASSFSGAGNVRFDKAKLYYMGHSQGGTTGPLFAPYAHDGNGNAFIHGYIFSGAGAGLVFSLLNKKSPADATIGIKLALQEVDLDEYHPVLALFQYYYDEVDPLVYGPLYYTEPLSQPVHVLHTFGQGDTYTPPETSRVFAASTGGEQLRQPDAGDWFDLISDLGMKDFVHKAPVAANIQLDWNEKTYKITGVTVQHLNDAKKSTDGKAYDGHFVAFRDKLCNKQVGTFLATAISKGTPSVPNK